MNDFYSPVLREWVFPQYQRLRKCNYPEKLDEAQQNQKLSSEEIEAIQFVKLEEMLRHAYTYVPYYQTLFRSLDIHPQDISNWDDFRKLPILTREEIRENFKSLISNKPRTPCVKYETSGSTGMPLTILTSQTAIAAEYACRFRAFAHWGIHIGDRVVYFQGASRYIPTRGWKRYPETYVLRPLKNHLLNRRIFAINNVSEEDLERQWRILKKFRPKSLNGFSSGMYQLAHYIQSMGYDGRALGIKLVVAGGEVLFDWQRDILEEVFGCPAANVYGSYEIGIAACSYPCGELHTNDDFVIVEVVKDKPEDEYGEIVATRLDNWEFPLIRCNTGDITAPLEEHQGCIHNLPFLKLAEIEGRKFDVLRLSNGRLVHGSFFSAMVKRAKGVKNFQIIQKKPDRFEIFVINDEFFTEDEEQYIRRRIEHVLGPLEVDIIQVESIPTEASGKFRFVRSEVEQLALIKG